MVQKVFLVKYVLRSRISGEKNGKFTFHLHCIHLPDKLYPSAVSRQVTRIPTVREHIKSQRYYKKVKDKTAD